MRHSQWEATKQWLMRKKGDGPASATLTVMEAMSEGGQGNADEEVAAGEQRSTVEKNESLDLDILCENGEQKNHREGKPGLSLGVWCGMLDG